MNLDVREWLETDGHGGYAMGTVCGIRTRRYHALWCVATSPPRARMVLVNGLEVFVSLPDGRRLALSSQRYRGGVVYPDGAARIAAFTHAPWPRWEFVLEDGTRLVQEVLLARNAPCLVMRWRCDAAATLIVRPLMSGRDHHALHHENPGFRFDPEVRGGALTWRPYSGVPAVTALSNGHYRHAPEWYRSFHYTEEEARGLDCVEDLASPGEFTFEFPDGPAVLVLSGGDLPDEREVADFAQARFAIESTRRRGSVLERAADAFLVEGAGGRTVIAGYPWFADWGRDTFIALRGLCLSTGRHDDARSILLAWSGRLSQGMLPNRFTAAGGAPEYNSVDASLWFIVAADAFLRSKAFCAPGDRRALEDAIEAIVAGYAAGTRYGIGADGDGLLRAGEPGTQLTWMDARADGRAVTPRVDKPVEVQALWINALAVAARRAPRWAEPLARARAAFDARFWNAGRRMLLDVVDVDHQAGRCDPRCRPNQILAVGGLPLPLLEGERARAVVDACEAELWTPAGLRSLAPGETGYIGAYRGGPGERDAAYHQGTAWAWLDGPFVEAWVRVRGGTAEAKAQARRRFLDPLLARLELMGLGHLAEIADGDPPHAPCGAPFQAWSVAEALRLERDVLA